ncbi:predicted protein [Plenodomus lingam JN3]|uniref:Predicted protein n=1 Tax=Leptosphaeria maculans (strain JN3 / isolate v23.1.3 / race Av1-4-5-6-7-8) TaxID=985895 RepID=E5A219_LEPMJ|nr:predicted protein [Plenodomus lingam JN3]CBX97736.1 predicted protein [Plenodomus lingam JN3]
MQSKEKVQAYSIQHTADSRQQTGLPLRDGKVCERCNLPMSTNAAAIDSSQETTRSSERTSASRQHVTPLFLLSCGMWRCYRRGKRGIRRSLPVMPGDPPSPLPSLARLARWMITTYPTNSRPARKLSLTPIPVCPERPNVAGKSMDLPCLGLANSSVTLLAAMKRKHYGACGGSHVSVMAHVLHVVSGCRGVERRLSVPMRRAELPIWCLVSGVSGKFQADKKGRSKHHPRMKDAYYVQV